MTKPKRDKKPSPGVSITGRRTANDNAGRTRDTALDELESYERPNREAPTRDTLEDAPDSPPREPQRRAEP